VANQSLRLFDSPGYSVGETSTNAKGHPITSAPLGAKPPPGLCVWTGEIGMDAEAARSGDFAPAYTIQHNDRLRRFSDLRQEEKGHGG